MTSPDVVRRGMRHQASFLHHLASSSAAGRVEQTEDYLLFAGSHDYPGTYTNGAIRTTTGIGAHELIARADAFFGDIGRQYYLWAEASEDADVSAAALARGFWPRPPETGSPCIVREAVLPDRPCPEGFGVRVASDDADRQLYLDLITRNYGLQGMDVELAESVLFSLASLDDPAVLILLADRIGEPGVCAASLAFLADDCIGLEWTATDPGARGHGLGSVLLTTATAWGFERGATCAWGVASQQGAPTWRRLGFDVPTHCHRYLSNAPAPSGTVTSGSSSRRSSRRRAARRAPDE